MNKSEIYKLPKDILVEMICIIERDTKERCEKEFQDQPINVQICQECKLTYHINHESIRGVCRHCVEERLRYNSYIKNIKNKNKGIFKNLNYYNNY